jgi:hypothetical protein
VSAAAAAIAARAADNVGEPNIRATYQYRIHSAHEIMSAAVSGDLRREPSMTGAETPQLDPRAERDLVTQLAADVLEQTAPEELAVFDETADDYFRDPQAVLDPRRRDEAVGFGIEVSLLAPFVLAVATPVVQFLVATVRDAAKDEARPLVAQLVRRLFRRDQPRHEGTPDSEPGPQPKPLTEEQARTVRRIAFERAQALGLPENTASVLADAVVGGVVVGG